VFTSITYYDPNNCIRLGKESLLKYLSKETEFVYGRSKIKTQVM
jgi:hypothetical protein